MKKFMITVLILFFLLGTAQAVKLSTPAASTNMQNPMESALISTGAKLREISVSGWTKANDRYMSEEEITTVAWQVAESLGMKKQSGEVSFNLQKDKGFVGANIQGQINDYTVGEIYYQSLKPEETGEPESYLTVVVTVNNQGRNELSKKWTKLVKEAISNQGRPEVSTVLIGVIPGKMNAKKQQVAAGRVFSLLGAKKSEGVGSKQMLSWTGYSDLFEEKLNVGDKQVNVNLAIRNNSQENETNIILGSPIITIEY